MTRGTLAEILNRNVSKYNRLREGISHEPELVLDLLEVKLVSLAMSGEKSCYHDGDANELAIVGKHLLENDIRFTKVDDDLLYIYW